MSTHIGAKDGEIAERVLLPGDPLRAKWIAETFLENVVCYNEIRGMLGFTGYYKGKRVSVQGTGMGMGSAGIYITELAKYYKVKKMIRVGTAGSYRDDVKIRDIVLAMSASTTSGVNRARFNGADYAPTADFNLLLKATEEAKKLNLEIKGGKIITSDEFYNDNKDDYKKWAEYGVMCVDMETAALYTIAAKYNIQALTILTISDSIVTGEKTSSEERQKTFKEMIELALETI